MSVLAVMWLCQYLQFCGYVSTCSSVAMSVLAVLWLCQYLQFCGYVSTCSSVAMSVLAVLWLCQYLQFCYLQLLFSAQQKTCAYMYGTKWQENLKTTGSCCMKCVYTKLKTIPSITVESSVCIDPVVCVCAFCIAVICNIIELLINFI